MFIIYSSKQKQHGVSLIEVLISILIIAIGVLGLAKMQALSIANTSVAGSRGLIALQASSLASLLHSNKAFWQVASPAASNCNGTSACNFSGTNSAPAAFAYTAQTCTYAAPCATQQIAAYDLNTWMGNMYSVAPTYGANINCQNSSNSPTSCVITISWSEKQTGMNVQTAANATGTTKATQYYYLYVQP